MSTLPIKCFAALTAVSLSLSALAFARTNTVKSLTADWTNPANFEDSSWLPGDGDDDTVIVPAHATVSLSDADAASLAQFKKIGRILFAAEDSELDIIVDGESPVEIPVPMTSYGYVKGSRDMKCGPVVKKGAGTLHLSSTSVVLAKYPDQCFAYYTELRADEGVLKLQQNTGKSKYSLGRITVAEGATVYLPSSSVANYTVNLQSLNGAGAVTRDSSVNCSLLFHGTSAVNPGDFSGCLSGTYMEVTFAGTGQVLSGVGSTTVKPLLQLKPSGTTADLGVYGLQGKDATSSIGYNVEEVRFQGADGARSVLNYLGPGGAVLASCGLYSGSSGALAANGTGAIDVQKPIQRYYRSPPAISHRNTRCVDRAGKYFLEYAG